MPTDDVHLIRALRLRAQGLVPGVRSWKRPSDVARGMLAMQAQDVQGFRWALAVRAQSAPTDQEVLASLEKREVVRNRPSRGTLQVTAADDLHWLTATMSPRSRQAAALRRHTIDVTDAMIERVEAIIRRELSSGGTITRPEIVAAAAADGLTLNGGQAGHILRDLTEQMVICFTAPEGRVDRFALADDWIEQPREVTGAAALTELVRRFVDARGPVTRQDVGRWAALRMSDVDEGLAGAGDAIQEARLADTDYLVAAGTQAPSSDEIATALARPLLLAPFDEYLLGYGSRAPIIADGDLDKVVPGRNGMFKPIVVVDGEIVGVWSRAATKTKLTITVEPFGRLTAAARRGLDEAAESYGTFLERGVVVRYA